MARLLWACDDLVSSMLRAVTSLFTMKMGQLRLSSMEKFITTGPCARYCEGAVMSFVRRQIQKSLFMPTKNLDSTVSIALMESSLLLFGMRMHSGFFWRVIVW